MKFKHIPLDDKYSLSYPVSSNIQSNIPIILDMIDKLKSEIKKYKRKKEVVLWCRGSSGAIIAGIMALHISNAKISHVKKEGEGSHSNDVSYMPNSNREIINVMVDDFVNTGATLNAIYEKMKKLKMKVHGVCVSGELVKSQLEFKPEFIISGEILK